jgi:hypothetical protein
MFRTMNAYGDRSKSLPRRLQDYNRVRQSGRIRVPNDPELPDKYREFQPGRGTNTDPLTAINDPTMTLFAAGGGGDGFNSRETCDLGFLCAYLAGGDGTSLNFDVSQVWPDNDNPYRDLSTLGGYADFRFITPDGPGYGPWLPKNKFVANAAQASYANPWDPDTGSYALQAGAYNGRLIEVDPCFNPDGTPCNAVLFDALLGQATVIGNNTMGAGALPYRPVPLYREDGAGVAQANSPGDPRGIFLPSKQLSALLDEGRLSRVESDFNFDEAERSWNRGASQKDEKELKEAYLDIETLDNRLWLRIGRQQIVWGKTELFRTTDQFNPTDAALASLPSLEESRIALWSVRGVYSFYEVGPLDDVRLELAFNWDDYQGTDLGACGEAYAPNITCQLTFGTFAHSIFGVGLAGAKKPKDPWQSVEGWEFGARLEWRYDRFSFALMDFYGYEDVPTITQISTFTRNVDPVTGRPREIFSTLQTQRPTVDPYTGAPIANVEQSGTQGPCITGLEQSCLLPKFDFDGSGTDGPRGDGITDTDVYEDDNGNGILDPGEDRDGDGYLDLGSEIEGLTSAAVAQQLFAYTCAGTVGFATSLDPAACSLNIFGSQQTTSGVVLSEAIGSTLAGSPIINNLAYAGANGGFWFPLVRLNTDPGDLDVDPGTGVGPANPNTNGFAPGTGCESLPQLLNGNPGVWCGAEAGTFALFGATDGVGPNVVVAQTLGGVLSPEQEALLGCGPFWGTQCDVDGIDLMTAEGSALYQSWPGLEGTVQNGDITIPWLTNQKVVDENGTTVFAQQPGTRGWYFDQTRDHAIAPICTTANFGGALFAYESGAGANDDANGNQAILPGCRRKWKSNPEQFRNPNPDPSGTQPDYTFDIYRALNLYGQDRVCAIERAENGGNTTSAACAGLGDFDSARVDPRSWELVRDGDPDADYAVDTSGLPATDRFAATNGLSVQNINYLGTTATTQILLPPPRDIGGVQTRAPDFFYNAPTYYDAGGTVVFGSQAQNPAAGAAFDSCDASAYPTQLIAEYGGAQFVPCGKGGHPMTGQPFSSEMAALSWNFLAFLVIQDGQTILTDRQEDCLTNPTDPFCSLTAYEQAREVFLDPDACSFVQPALCDTFRTLQGAVGLQRNVRKSGGNGVHGRRTFTWQSGGEAILTYNKRNVLGFSMDFAEDVSKANFSFEFTWIEGVQVANRNQYDDLDTVNDFNLTMSVDRPTFINFLNANRTFFFNWQVFVGYRQGWEKGMTTEGAWSMLTTFTVGTAYFQDRLSPNITSVYDVQTQSGAILTGISYRFTQNFSAAVGMAFFYGKPDFVDEPIAGFGPAGNRSQADADHLYKSGREGGLAIVRDRDEMWARIRYTF